jgi:hypothetical protein
MLPQLDDTPNSDLDDYDEAELDDIFDQLSSDSQAT